MKHQEAINKLQSLKSIVEPMDNRALEYAIRHLEHIEIYEKPINMNVWDNAGGKFKKEVFGKLNDQYICKDSGGDFISFDNAEPIIEDCLQFFDWLSTTNYIQDLNAYEKWFQNEIFQEYIQYLNDFKP